MQAPSEGLGWGTSVATGWALPGILMTCELVGVVEAPSARGHAGLHEGFSHWVLFGNTFMDPCFPQESHSAVPPEPAPVKPPTPANMAIKRRRSEVALGRGGILAGASSPWCPLSCGIMHTLLACPSGQLSPLLQTQLLAFSFAPCGI